MLRMFGTHDSTGNMMSLCQGKDFIFTKIVFFQHWFNKMTLLAIFYCHTIFVSTIITFYFTFIRVSPENQQFEKIDLWT